MTCIIGTKEQVLAAESLIARCISDIPYGVLDGLTVQFGLPERLLAGEAKYGKPGRRPPSMYGGHVIYLRDGETEQGFYEELSHFLDDVAGRGIARHKIGAIFARKWGVARRKVCVANLA